MVISRLFKQRDGVFPSWSTPRQPEGHQLQILLWVLKATSIYLTFLHVSSEVTAIECPTLSLSNEQDVGLCSDGGGVS